jgi:hypothetical protein
VLRGKILGVVTNSNSDRSQRPEMLRNYFTILLIYLATIEARKGIDISRLMFGFDLKCFKEGGYEFVVVRAYRTIGCFPDPDASDTILKARGAGFKQIDIYMSPCPGGKPAVDQVDEMSKSQV